MNGYLVMLTRKLNRVSVRDVKVPIGINRDGMQRPRKGVMNARLSCVPKRGKRILRAV